jgi:hypothetical protein
MMFSRSHRNLCLFSIRVRVPSDLIPTISSHANSLQPIKVRTQPRVVTAVSRKPLHILHQAFFPPSYTSTKLVLFRVRTFDLSTRTYHTIYGTTVTQPGKRLPLRAAAVWQWATSPFALQPIYFRVLARHLHPYQPQFLISDIYTTTLNSRTQHSSMTLRIDP